MWQIFGENARVSGKKGMNHLNMKSGYDLNLCLQTILIALFRRLVSFAVWISEDDGMRRFCPDG